MFSACSITNAESYSKACEVSICEAGWKVSDDKSKCIANQCSCSNGVGSSETKCLIDGASQCESCNAGFKLASDSKSCTGTMCRLPSNVADDNHVLNGIYKFSGCGITNAESYSKACELSSCEAGWTVSDDKIKCIANQCSCANGVGSSGAKCPTGGDSKCESCNAGFKLASDSKSCAGTLPRLNVIVSDGNHAYLPTLAFGTYVAHQFASIMAIFTHVFSM